MPSIVAAPTKKLKIHKSKAVLLGLMKNVASIAMALEALETLLLEKGILKENELMERLEKVAREHWAKDENIPVSED
jgi:hypothetical protein